MASQGTTDLGLIGLGAMGAPFAARLLESGRTLAVHDARRAAAEAFAARGAVACESPADVADRTPLVLVSLPTPDVVREVATGEQGIVHGRAVRTYVDLSTTGPPVAEEVAAALTAAGIDVLDSPVSGGVAGAKAGNLAIMAAGPRPVFEAVRPVLEVLGSNVFHVGERPGQGQLVKVLNNLLSATAIVATSEAMTLGVKGGLSPRTLLDVFNAGSGRNTATSDKFPRAVLTRTLDIGFRLKLMTKDVHLCLEEARRRDVPMILGSTVEQLWGLAAARSPDDADSMAILELFEQWAGQVVEEPEGR
jgi:3-hydroxyisobutyrate dehydrogenase-like beta-hydroxyacid dehydrogenase